MELTPAPLAGGLIVATSGGRYRIGGREFIAAGNAFWACGPITPG